MCLLSLTHPIYLSIAYIQILHWCYETASQRHVAATAAAASSSSISTTTTTTTTLSQVQYWTEQLKQVHMIRYGSLGYSLEKVRRIMKETRKQLTLASITSSSSSTKVNLPVHQEHQHKQPLSIDDPRNLQGTVALLL